jgi:hypothetical protein
LADILRFLIVVGNVSTLAVLVSFILPGIM